MNKVLDFKLDEQIMEKINRFSRTALTAEQVYAFPVALCDNEIDRDGERFSAEALGKLAKLFVGKTGIFDHDPKGEKQSARIFDCETVQDETRVTSCGEPYTCLYAKAYMVRTAGNADLIAEIDGGIKKEVSVSCSIGKKLCSVCGADMNRDPCGHIKGTYYGGKKCCHILDEPTDAYEWSFVAVPAQPAAGVVKHFGEEKDFSQEVRSLEKRLAAESARTQKACDMLKREIISLSFLCRPVMAVETVKILTDKMSFEQLTELYHSLKKQAQQNDEPKPQLVSKKTDGGKSGENSRFRIAG